MILRKFFKISIIKINHYYYLLILKLSVIVEIHYPKWNNTEKSKDFEKTRKLSRITKNINQDKKEYNKDKDDDKNEDNMDNYDYKDDNNKI